jgi:outer membrane lipoprotein-sorting protein
VKYYISDGTTLWVYEKVNKQAFKQDLKDQLLPVAITFLYGQGDLSKDFTASLEPGKYGGKNDLVVKLVPNQPTAQYKFLWLVVDPTDFHVKESIIQEISGNLNSFAFSSIKTNAAAKYVGANLFKFVPPKGVKVVSPPAQMAQPGAPAAKGDSK